MDIQSWGQYHGFREPKKVYRFEHVLPEVVKPFSIQKDCWPWVAQLWVWKDLMCQCDSWWSCYVSEAMQLSPSQSKWNWHPTRSTSVEKHSLWLVPWVPTQLVHGASNHRVAMLRSTWTSSRTSKSSEHGSKTSQTCQTCHVSERHNGHKDSEHKTKRPEIPEIPEIPETLMAMPGILVSDGSVEFRPSRTFVAPGPTCCEKGSNTDSWGMLRMSKLRHWLQCVVTLTVGRGYHDTSDDIQLTKLERCWPNFHAWDTEWYGPEWSHPLERHG